MAKAGQHEEAVACLEVLLVACGGDADPETRKRAAAALREKERELLRLGRSIESSATCEELVRRFGADSDPAIRRLVGAGLLMQWAALTKEKRHADAEAVADWILDGYPGHPTSGAVDAVAANAVLAKGRSARSQGDSMRALEVFDALIATYPDVSDGGVARAVASGLMAKAELLDGLDRPDQATATRATLIELFRGTTDIRVRPLLGTAMLAQAVALDHAGHVEESLIMLRELSEDFADVAPGR